MKRLLISLTVLVPLLAPAGGWAANPCFPNATSLCLAGARFTAQATWTAPGFGSGAGQAVPLTADTGTFWFFSNSNTELVVKVLDGRALNRHFWVFYGGLSDVEYTLTVTDTQTGAQAVYHNPAGHLASASDVTAFGPEDPAATPAGPTAVPSPSAPLRLGPESQVNVTTHGDQWSPKVAIGPDGSYLVAWLGEPGGVQGRWFDAGGRPRGGEVVLTTGTTDPKGLRVAVDASGTYMVAWNSGGHVTSRRFSAGGQPLGGETAIGFSPQQQGFPDVVADPAGGFLVAWPEYGDGSLRWQRFNAQGNPVGNEIAIPRQGTDVHLAAFPAGGGFVIAWTEVVGALDMDVRALRLDAAGKPSTLSALDANIGAARLGGYQQLSAPVVHPDGGFSVVWATYAYNPGDPAGLYARRYGADGQASGDVLQLSGGARTGAWPPITLALPTGSVLVLWYEEGRIEDLDGGLFGRTYDTSWNPLGGPFRINTYTQNLQVRPTAAVDAAGNLVTAWESAVPQQWIPELPPDLFGKGQDGDGSGVFSQRFTTHTCAGGSGELCLGDRFRVAVQFTDPRSGKPGAGQAIPLTSDTGAFWFFDAGNVELIVKVLDGGAVNGHFWVFYGALSDVEYTVRVTDTVMGKTHTYKNGPHHLASGADTLAFPAAAGLP